MTTKKGLALLAGLALLTATAAAAPKGTTAGKDFDCAATVTQRCEACHYRSRICDRLGRTSERRWRKIIARMMRHGARIDAGTAKRLARCLATGTRETVCP